MDTILKHNFKPYFKIFDSISFRIILICAITSLAAILISNVIYFRNISKSIYTAKQSELTTAATEISASLSAYDHSYVPDFSSIETNVYRRIFIVDPALKIRSDSFENDSYINKTLFHPAAVEALAGNDYFSYNPNKSTIDSCASKPIISDGKIIGAVVIFETDLSISNISKTFIQTTILIDIIIFALLIICSLIIIYLLSKRITNLVSSVKKSNDDMQSKKIEIEHNDEIAPILREFNDIQDRISYIQQMRQAFVSDASHELRTPLAAIRLLCESITQTDNIDEETVREFMEDIILEVDRMSHTAEKLLVLSKLDNVSNTNLAPISLTEITEKIITTLQPIADDKDVTIESYIENDCSILGEMEGANQIIANLIDNAIKYNNIGGTLRIYLFKNHNKCTFITDDTGIGISPEFREHVFERFYRVDKSRKHDGRGGSGLGLAIVKRNVESFGGTISITDSAFGGTRFTVTFPSLLSDEEVEF